MSNHPSFTSGDFAHVPRALRAAVEDNLVHTDVLDTNAAADLDFSRKRRHLVRPVRLPSRVLSVTIGGLEPGEATNQHRHNYETIIYFISGTGMSLIEGREVQWAAGDAIYIPVWAWHQHMNRGSEPVRYVACENAPMLQNLGIALREEQGDVE